MARARNIKPKFFTNQELVELPFSTRLLFIGLWTLADREGRLEDKPKTIKMQVYPGDSVDVDAALNELATSKDAQGVPFIVRYRNSEGSFIQISKFKTHQSPHYSEKQSIIKPPTLPDLNGDDAVTTPRKPPDDSGNTGGIKRGSQPPDSLNPDSLNPERRLSDSPNPESLGKARRKAAALPATTGEIRPEVQVVIWLKSQGITAQASDPRVIGFARENVTEQHIAEAVAMARTRPGKAEGRIHFAYLCGILTDIMHPKAGAKGGPSGIDQWLESQGVSRETPALSKRDLAAKQWLEESQPAIER